MLVLINLSYSLTDSHVLLYPPFAVEYSENNNNNIIIIVTVTVTFKANTSCLPDGCLHGNNRVIGCG